MARVGRRLRTLVALVSIGATQAVAFAQDAPPATVSATRPAILSPADAVDVAIARGTTFLLTRPDFIKNGNWEDSPKRESDDNQGAQWGGKTALCTYALLAGGVSPNDPRLRPAIEFLRNADIIGTYALGLRAQVWLYLPKTKDNQSAIARDTTMLLKALKRNPARSDGGLFDYVASDRERIDLSVSQYGVLGLWACSQLDAAVDRGGPGSIWRLIDSRWRLLQDGETGSWSYRGGRGKGTPSMTAAGVATLFITQDYLAASDGSGGGSDGKETEALEKGLAFLTAELPQLLSANGSGWRHYALYGIERVGVASGRKYFGKVDWYRAGSEFLRDTQGATGEWHGENGEEVTTSFALLFLARGREPVMTNKLRFEKLDSDGAATEADWNERSRDVQNVTRFVARRSERNLNWQTIDLSVANARDLHDAPIAFVAAPGVRSLRLPEAQVALLRTYVEQGGLLVINIDQPQRTPTSRPDAATPPKSPLLDALFDQPLALRALPADHPIFTREQFKSANWTAKPTVWGVSNGVRELAIVLGEDSARAWQANDVTRGRVAFELMANVYQYAIDKDHPQPKGRTYVVDLDASLPTTASVGVARLKYDGNWDPEPGGWRRLQAIERRDRQLDLQLETVDLANGTLDGVAIAHVTGTAPVTFAPPTIEKLKRFVGRGGLLVIDAAGGSAAFAASVEQQLDRIAGPAAKGGGQAIATSDPLLATADGAPYRARYRSFALASITSPSMPRLRGVRGPDKRWSVVYSPDDLSAGLVGSDVDGIRGYTPEVATDLMGRIVRYAAARQR